jgi:hypothetical protein
MQIHVTRVESAVANPSASPEWRQHGHRAACSCGWKGVVLLGDAAERSARKAAENHQSPHLAPADDWIAR